LDGRGRAAITFLRHILKLASASSNQGNFGHGEQAVENDEGKQ
jgi:hypothetical protein